MRNTEIKRTEKAGVKLISAIEKKAAKETKEKVNSVFASAESLNNFANYRLTKREKAKFEKATTKKERKEIITAHVAKYNNEYAQKEIARINQALASNYTKPFELILKIEWKKSRTWGANPKGEMWGDNYCSTGSIGGCGYDKLSTCVAQLLNESPKLLARSLRFDKKSLGYGSGYGNILSFVGGVGCECFETIIKQLGGEWSHDSGRMFDVIKIKFN